MASKPPTLNPDGISVKGCSYIYAPKGQAGEYSVLAANPYRGCGHKCAYCYVPLVLKMRRTEFDARALPRKDFLKQLAKDAAKYQALGVTEQVMLSFTTDVYHPGDTSLTTPTIEILKDFGLGFCVLTKGGFRAAKDIGYYRSDRDAFATSLTSVYDDFSRKWERGAAPPKERMVMLKRFFNKDIWTWASLEPVLDPAQTLQLIRETHSYVNFYKVGRVNYLPLTRKIDWRKFTEDVINLMAQVGAKHYIKKDLQQYLPAGYENPVRVPQHH